jgi:hypothetical protein
MRMRSSLPHSFDDVQIERRNAFWNVITLDVFGLPSDILMEFVKGFPSLRNLIDIAFVRDYLAEILN